MSDTISGTVPETITAKVRYLADRNAAAVYMASEAGGEVPDHKGNFADLDVPVHNGRDLETSLDREGFVFVEHKSAVADFYDDGQIADTYDDEIRALVAKTTGAKRVEIFDHTRRASTDAMRKEKNLREPASIIHNDYSAASGAKRIREILGEEAEDLLAGGAAIINVWRSIAGPVRSVPLALCDASSVVPEDLVPITRQAKDRIGEIQFAVPNPDHRWVWFPEMTRDEALVFKTWDSSDDGRARYAVHTAFENPLAPADAPVRESIETRCFVFF